MNSYYNRSISSLPCGLTLPWLQFPAHLRAIGQLFHNSDKDNHLCQRPLLHNITLGLWNIMTMLNNHVRTCVRTICGKWTVRYLWPQQLPRRHWRIFGIVAGAKSARVIRMGHWSLQKESKRGISNTRGITQCTGNDVEIQAILSITKENDLFQKHYDVDIEAKSVQCCYCYSCSQQM